MATENQYRLYVLTNMYLSQLQRGIQTAHVVAEMGRDYGKFPDPMPASVTTYLDWCETDKTIIVLDGGHQQDLERVERLLLDNEDERQFRPNGKIDLPWAGFREEEVALNNAMTAIGIILPEYLWRWDLRAFEKPPEATQELAEVLEIIQSAKLA